MQVSKISCDSSYSPNFKAELKILDNRSAQSKFKEETKNQIIDTFRQITDSYSGTLELQLNDHGAGKFSHPVPDNLTFKNNNLEEVISGFFDAPEEYLIGRLFESLMWFRRIEEARKNISDMFTNRQKV